MLALCQINHSAAEWDKTFSSSRRRKPAGCNLQIEALVGLAQVPFSTSTWVTVKSSSTGQWDRKKLLSIDSSSFNMEELETWEILGFFCLSSYCFPSLTFLHIVLIHHFWMIESLESFFFSHFLAAMYLKIWLRLSWSLSKPLAADHPNHSQQHAIYILRRNLRHNVTSSIFFFSCFVVIYFTKLHLAFFFWGVWLL